jgi:demethylmenaquinone methyltransferase/2-methoxy-6-polyprenyl-1,4-benzoquinol methylase
MKSEKQVMPPTDEERVGYVREMFSRITPRYDFLNRFLSLRRDVAWRRSTVKRMRFFSTYSFLDVATGTADLAIAAALMHLDITVTGVDFVPEMLALGREKIRGTGLPDRVELIEGDAMHLPFENDTFDVAAIAFGIRNIPDRVRALSEMARVVAPGGQVMVLELTPPQSGLSRGLYGLYLRRLLPRIGRFFSGNRRAYCYLAESIMDFPTPDEFTEIMRSAGLQRVEKVPLTLGVAHLHIGTTKS